MRSAGLLFLISCILLAPPAQTAPLRGDMAPSGDQPAVIELHEVSGPQSAIYHIKKKAASPLSCRLGGSTVLALVQPQEGVRVQPLGPLRPNEVAVEFEDDFYVELIYSKTPANPGNGVTAMTAKFFDQYQRPVAEALFTAQMNSRGCYDFYEVQFVK